MTVPLRSDLSVTKAEDLDRLTATEQFKAWLTSRDDSKLQAHVALARPLTVAVPVEVVSSRLGVTMVRPSAGDRLPSDALIDESGAKSCP